jgi:hypothetical protein
MVFFLRFFLAHFPLKSWEWEYSRYYKIGFVLHLYFLNLNVSLSFFITIIIIIVVVGLKYWLKILQLFNFHSFDFGEVEGLS